MTSNRQALVELGERPVFGLLLQYAVPAIVAMVAASLYNIVDGVFIGQGVGPEAITGLAVTLPIMNLSAAFGAMVGVGGSTLLSVKLGERDYGFAARILGNVITLNCILGLVLGGATLVFLDPILGYFGASAATLPYARDFMTVILAGNVVTHLFLGLNAMLRSAGKPRQAMTATILTVVANALLAPLFIFVLRWGITGAALATVVSQALVLLWQLRLFSRPDELVRLRRGTYRLERRIVSGCLTIGLSPFLINVCACLVVIIVNRQLLAYGGDLAVGAYGIANRLIMFFVMVVIGINQGMQPVAGFNFGARNFARLTAVLKHSIILATGVFLVGFAIAELASWHLARAFTADAALASVSAHAIRVLNIAIPIVGFQIVATGFFQSIGKAGISIFMALTRQLLFLVPALVVLPRFFGLEGVWYSMPVADTLSTVTTAVALIYYIRKFKAVAKSAPGRVETQG